MSDILNQFVNYSGGAYGADTLGDIIGREYGFNNHTHFRPYDNPNVSMSLQKRGVSGFLLTKQQTNDARMAVNVALNKNYKNNVAGNLQGRNYFQVLNADAVYCFSRKIDSNTISGGTNTAFQLAIKTEKLLWLFDIEELVWYKYNTFNECLERCPVPYLQKAYAIVGSRDIENYKVKSNIGWIDRPAYIGDIRSQRVKDAIENLYIETIKHYKANLYGIHENTEITKGFI